ncbi:FCD domain-containing protein [Paenibacillus konkukensis]|uniref:FCD domain-containing protein n=1 Tax=Paenibacillus konkukensis TaxID=2020716 RepID=UPI00201D88E5|nr:FCD domain-containing protein [Paenibacillus konkukensis]
MDIKLVENVDKLDEGSFFASRNEYSEYLVLKYLIQSDEPVGSWVLKVMLGLKGIELSTATIGRLLKELDSKGFTKLVDAQGRVITSEGIGYAKMQSERIERERLQARLMMAAIPQSLDELIDLLHARKALECETARLAALRANPKDIDELELSLKKHADVVKGKIDPTDIALDFHIKVAKASYNRFLIASLDILIYEELRLESQIARLITRERGEEYLLQHISIVESIKQNDPHEAERRMGVHIETLINAIKEQAERK